MYDTRRPSDALGPKFSNEKTRRLVDPPFGSRTLYAAVCHGKTLLHTALEHDGVRRMAGFVGAPSNIFVLRAHSGGLTAAQYARLGPGSSVHTCPHMSTHVHTWCTLIF